MANEGLRCVEPPRTWDGECRTSLRIRIVDPHVLTRNLFIANWGLGMRPSSPQKENDKRTFDNFFTER